MFKIKGKRFTTTQIIITAYIAIIMFGTFLLCLPFSAKSGAVTPFADALFTATSATCVTGLVVYDTYAHWSLFGQTVILVLIQIGGLGFMSVATLVSFMLGRRIGLAQRQLIMDSTNAGRLSGVVRVIKRVLIATVIFEGFGTVLLCFRFCPEMGLLKGLYNAVFHSVSAFCNAGFDLMGRYEPNSSLIRYASDPLVSLTIAGLIIIGGLGFFVWSDLFNKRFHYKKYELNTKIVLTSTASLLIIGCALLMIFERNTVLSSFSFPRALMISFFQSTTPRTAGFNTVDMAAVSDAGTLLLMVFMIIGGSPASTAGGIKTTTFSTLMLSAFAAARQKPSVNLFGRRLEDTAIKKAQTIATIYITLAFFAVLLISAIEPFGLREVFFEVLSAIGTVGLTKGITAQLSEFSRLVLTFLMYAGKVGGLSLALFFTGRHETTPLTKPAEKILIG